MLTRPALVNTLSQPPTRHVVRAATETASTNGAVSTAVVDFDELSDIIRWGSGTVGGAAPGGGLCTLEAPGPSCRLTGRIECNLGAGASRAGLAGAQRMQPADSTLSWGALASVSTDLRYLFVKYEIRVHSGRPRA